VAVLPLRAQQERPSFSSPRGKYPTAARPTYASHSLHGGTPGNWQGGRCIACAQGLAHSSREALIRSKKLLQLGEELEAERGAKVKAELTQARSDAELRRSKERGDRERELAAAKSVQLSESVQLSSFPSESAARRAALESCVPCSSQAEQEEEQELDGTRAAHERKGVQLSEGKLSDQLEAALRSALLELKEARAELRMQRDCSEESKSAAEESQQESFRLQGEALLRSSRAEAEAKELREQLRAAQAEQQTLRLRCTAAEEELLAQGSAGRIAGRTQQVTAVHTHCMLHAQGTCAGTLHVHPQVPPSLLTTAVGGRRLPPLPAHTASSLPAHTASSLPAHTCLPTLHPHCLPTLHPHCLPSLHPHCLPTLHPHCLPSLLPTRRAHGEHTACTTRGMHMHDARGIHAACTRHARSMHAACTRHARSMHAACTRHVASRLSPLQAEAEAAMRSRQETRRDEERRDEAASAEEARRVREGEEEARHEEARLRAAVRRDAVLDTVKGAATAQAHCSTLP
jgi:hypothetical protein